MVSVKKLGDRVQRLAFLPPLPHLGLLCRRVLDPCPVNHCSHTVFLGKDKVLRSPVELTRNYRRQRAVILLRQLSIIAIVCPAILQIDRAIFDLLTRNLEVFH